MATNSREVVKSNNQRKAAVLHETRELPRDPIRLTSTQRNKTVDAAGSFDNPIVIDSSSGGSLSAESLMGDRTRMTTNNQDQPAGKALFNATTGLIVPYSSSEENSVIKMNKEKDRKEQYSSITLS